MAPQRNQQSNNGGERGSVNQNAAEDIVLDNLGMDRAELGMDADGDEDDDNSGDDQNLNERDEQNQNGDGRDDENDSEDEREQHLQDREQRRNNIMRDPKDRQQQRQQRPLPKNGPVKADAKGNLVNAEGQIVAKAGKEARLYVDLHKTRQTLTQRESHTHEVTSRLNRAVEIATDLNTQLDEYKARDTTIRELGITPQEQLEAVQLFTEGKKNPLELLKKLLTRAAAGGIDISTLGAQAGGFDPKSLMDMVKGEIANHLKPLKDKSEAESRQTEQQREAEANRTKTEQHVRGFFNENQEALPYVPLFKELMADNRFRQMPLSEMWARIQLQVERAQRNNGGDNRQNRRRRNQPSLPNGRGGPRGDNQQPDIASPSQSYDAILNDVMDKEYRGGRRR